MPSTSIPSHSRSLPPLPSWQGPREIFKDAPDAFVHGVDSENHSRGVLPRAGDATLAVSLERPGHETGAGGRYRSRIVGFRRGARPCFSQVAC